MCPSRALYHPLASMLALAALLLPLSSGESFAQDCATLEKPVMAARAAGDLPGVNAAVAAAKSSAGVCSGDDLRRIAHLGALAYYDKAIAQELTNEQRKELLEQGLKISAPWKMSATLAQLEAESKNYARAAELYQNALDDIADAKLNPVPPGVPSDTHSSRPTTPSSAAKTTRPLISVNPPGFDEPVAWMFFTICVPPSVPSEDHSSTPFVPSSALKKSRPLATQNSEGFELSDPVRMSLTRPVPASVPSVAQSSIPFVPLLAAKKIFPA